MDQLEQLVKSLNNNRMSYANKMLMIYNTPGLKGDDFIILTRKLGYKPGFAKHLAREYDEYKYYRLREMINI